LFLDTPCDSQPIGFIHATQITRVEPEICNGASAVSIFSLFLLPLNFVFAFSTYMRDFPSGATEMTSSVASWLL
jgi:hypothetical protein